MKKAAATKGLSLARGARNMVSDWRHNGGMPSQVDTRPFEVGGNLAVSPGAVVYRSDVLELIQYEPTTPTVRERPVMIIPPQINRFYFLDLAPGRSFIEHAVGPGAHGVHHLVAQPHAGATRLVARHLRRRLPRRRRGGVRRSPAATTST